MNAQTAESYATAIANRKEDDMNAREAVEQILKDDRDLGNKCLRLSQDNTRLRSQVDTLESAVTEARRNAEEQYDTVSALRHQIDRFRAVLERHSAHIHDMTKWGPQNCKCHTCAMGRDFAALLAEKGTDDAV